MYIYIYIFLSLSPSLSLSVSLCLSLSFSLSISICKVSNKIRTTIQMSQCADHKTIFLDTHRHFHLSINISRKFAIPLASFQPQRASFQVMLGFAAYGC